MFAHLTMMGKDPQVWIIDKNPLMGIYACQFYVPNILLAWIFGRVPAKIH